MKLVSCLIAAFALTVASAAADTYTGIVSGVKHFARGGVAVDLDGHYPDQKMTLYVSARAEVAVGTLPAEGAKVTATGKITSYKGKSEIKITSPNQWKW
jgi:exonuclease VII large subunit